MGGGGGFFVGGLVEHIAEKERVGLKKGVRPEGGGESLGKEVKNLF